MIRIKQLLFISYSVGIGILKVCNLVLKIKKGLVDDAPHCSNVESAGCLVFVITLTSTAGVMLAIPSQMLAFISCVVFGFT